MKLRFLKDHIKDSFSFKKGDVVELGRQFGKRLINKGIAVATEEATPKEEIAESKKIADARDIFDDYPERAKDIVRRIRKETNEDVLRMLIDDERGTVRYAARKRLNSIIYGSE